MKYRQLGKSGLRVSALSYGTMTFGAKGWFAKGGGTDAAGAERVLDLLHDAGVNLVDTSDAYSGGAGEEVLGRALRGRRDRFLVATKARYPMDRHGDEATSGPNDAGLSRHHLIAACEASLRRLGIDHIDLYQMHGWDGQTPLEETHEALDSLIRSGKVRYIGCSNFAGWQLMKSLAVAERLGYQRYVSQQIFYSLQSREAEYELVPVALDQGVGILTWSPLAGGLMSGKYRRNQPLPEGRHRNDFGEPPVRDVDLLYDIVDVLLNVAEAHDATAAQVALCYLLNKPGVSSVVVGARNEEQLLSNLKAMDLELGEDEWKRLDEVSAPPLIYPHWHQLHNWDRWGPAEEPLLKPHMQNYRSLVAIEAPDGTPLTTDTLPLDRYTSSGKPSERTHTKGPGQVPVGHSN